MGNRPIGYSHERPSTAGHGAGGGGQVAEERTMNCDECGREITRGYKWQGQTLGSDCFKKVNPWSIDPAATLLAVAEAVVNGDKSLLSLLPTTWRPYITSKSRIRNAWNASGCFDGSHAYNLALLARNDYARTGEIVFPLEDLLALRQD